MSGIYDGSYYENRGGEDFYERCGCEKEKEEVEEVEKRKKMPKNLYYNKEFADKMVLAEKMKQLEDWKDLLFDVVTSCATLLRKLEDFKHEPFYKNIDELQQQAVKEINEIVDELVKLYGEES